MDFLKAEQLGSSKWRVLAIPFGGPRKGGLDLDGEYFSPKTDIKADWFEKRPVLWHHGQDPNVKDAVIGTEGELTKESDGWWAEMWLDRSNAYWSHVNSLLQAGKVFGSSGSMGHLVQKARDGEITVWPHIEQTLTPTPANPFARVIPTKALTHFSSAGIELDPALRGVLAELDQLKADLRPDLSSDGDDAAMVRLTETLSDLDEALRLVP